MSLVRWLSRSSSTFGPPSGTKGEGELTRSREDPVGGLLVVELRHLRWRYRESRFKRRRRSVGDGFRFRDRRRRI